MQFLVCLIHQTIWQKEKKLINLSYVSYYRRKTMGKDNESRSTNKADRNNATNTATPEEEAYDYIPDHGE